VAEALFLKTASPSDVVPVAWEASAPLLSTASPETAETDKHALRIPRELRLVPVEYRRWAQFPNKERLVAREELPEAQATF